MKANEYKILSASKVDRLVEKVNQSLKHGWQRYGKPYCCGNGYHHQAVVIPTTNADYEDNSRPLM